jgi:hypothetical protein
VDTDDEFDPAVSIDLRGVTVSLAIATDGQPVLVAGDDSGAAVAFELGAGGAVRDALAGADLLAERFAMLAAVLRVRLGDRAPLAPFNPSPEEIATWLAGHGLSVEVAWWDGAKGPWSLPPPINGTQPVGTIRTADADDRTSPEG